MFICVWTTLAQKNSARPALPLGRHFIVLIDDSCSMGCGDSRYKKQNIIADLPGRLFGGTKGVKAFEPKNDRLSVVFFTIQNGSVACGPRQPNSVLPENIFDLAFTGNIKSKEDFTRELQNWMADSCRFKGHWSPIVISSLLVLPYLQPRLPAGELHSQTILIQVTDGEFNPRTTPGHELTDYHHTQEINHIDVADKLLNKVSRLFSLNIHPDQRPVNDVFYLTAEYTSQRVPESVVQYQRNSSLYPQALSSGELRYRLNDQPLGDIQLLSAGTEAGLDFRPLWLRVGFQNSQGGDWRIGDQTLPRLTETTERVSLSPCQLPQCEATNDRIGIRLFDAALGRALKVSSSAADPGPGQIKFNIGFHYNTDVYNHLCVQTPELLINADTAPPAEIPNLLLPSSRLTKADIAGQWTNDDDGVTTQEEAKNRILARRNVRVLLAVIALVVVVVALMIFLFLRYYGRAFGPRLKWLPRRKVVIDFNQSAASRILVGTLQVENDQPAPWLGRLLKNEEQPARRAEISLNYNYFEKSGLKLDGKDPIGFVHGEKENGHQEELGRTTVETVSDGREVHIFFAAERIDDYHPGNGALASADAEFTIPVKARMEWKAQHVSAGRSSKVNEAWRWLKGRIASDRSDNVEADLDCNLILKPEAPRKPIVTYVPTQKTKLYFKKDSLVHVGSFWFESQADKDFARAYSWDGYTIKSYQGNRPLTGEPIRLAHTSVEVAPKAQVEVPVYIHCDNETIPNPDPASCEYSFKLFGDFSADSEPGPYFTTLYRDPTRAEIELRVISPKRQLEVYWTADGSTKLRTLPDGVDADELLDGSDSILLDPQTIKFNPLTGGMREPLSLEFGNSCDVGDGVVHVKLSTRIRCEPAIRNAIEMENGRPLEDLVEVYDFKVRKSDITIRAGEPVQTRAIKLFPGKISRIFSGRIKAEDIAAEIMLDINVVDGQGGVKHRTLTVVIPFSIEQLPGLNWLAIDFGTSAISAALGSGESAMMVPLQDITVTGGLSLARHDTENSERRNHNLLPSWICCNWDLRTPSGDRKRPGFPGYYSEELSMSPGESDFIGLPAVTHELAEHPGRIIYSLKSWLATASPNIPISINKDGKQVQQLLPLEKMVESGFAALADAYLFEPAFRADQIVIAHPNTFTRRHQNLLHRIAHRALGKPERFGIPLMERIHLISESDAVAHYYCFEQMRTQPRAGVERLLVYDFGAGTLDLSIIRVLWKDDAPHYPIEWNVEKRLGVPVAGNYIDEILARLIHRLLSDHAIVEAKGFEYFLPVVGRTFNQIDPNEYRRAITRLWNWIREAKHEWSSKCREVLAQGGTLSDCPPFNVKVGVGKELEVVRYATGQRPDVEEPVDQPGLWVVGLGDIYLSIPSRVIEEDGRMRKFMEFVTEDFIDEALGSIGLTDSDIDTVIVSGRGARYPGLRERVLQRFTYAETPDLLTSDSMKSAVVLGAIARQSLSRQFTDASDDASLAPQLGLLRNFGDDLVLEKDWDKAIDLTTSPTFRLVQVNLKTPNPRTDKKSFRRHFYIDLADPYFVRDDILGDEKYLHIRKETKRGELAIYLGGKDGSPPRSVFPEDQIASTVTRPPWPIGNVLLNPQD